MLKVPCFSFLCLQRRRPAGARVPGAVRARLLPVSRAVRWARPPASLPPSLLGRRRFEGFFECWFRLQDVGQVEGNPHSDGGVWGGCPLVVGYEAKFPILIVSNLFLLLPSKRTKKSSLERYFQFLRGFWCA